MEALNLTIFEIKKILAEKKISSVDLVQSYLNLIKRRNTQIHAFLEVFDGVLDQAHQWDEKRSKGESLPPLAGIPIAIKDNILFQGHVTSAGSKILENHQASYNATVVDRLKKAGAIIIGRTNCDEFAMGSSCENSAYENTFNPWDTKRVPGGSSGGSAAAVAAGMTPAALGSDTGGSIRQPASLCGVVGLKPTYGRVSRYGLIALASSLDQIGPMTRTVEDAALILEAIEGPDPKDATSSNEINTTVAELINSDINGVKIGLPKEYFTKGLDSKIKDQIDRVIKLLESKGAVFKEVQLPHTDYSLAAYYIVMPSEASSNLARFDGIRYGQSKRSENLDELYKRTRGEGFGAEVKRRIMLGTYALSSGYYDAYYKKALQVRAKIREDFDRVFNEVDCLLTPTSPTIAWEIGAKVDDPLEMYLSDIYTISLNLAGLPGMSVPCGFVNNLPVGFQLIGQAFDEYTLFRVGKAYQEETDWHKTAPNFD